MRFIKKITNQEYDDLIKWLDNNTISNVSEKEECLREVKQKGQKPAEWNEEDKEMLGKVLECIRFAEDRYQLEQEETNGVSVKLWLLDHIIPQQKQEWSEEDKKMCNNILNVLTPYLVYDGTYTRTTFGKKYKYGSEIRWIKSLPERFNIQPKQEWSEEDEKDMAHIIRILDDCYVYGTHDLSKTDRENLVNKLKSLRPSWKPSEEQMKALYDACCIAFVEERDFHTSLSRLYHDLRKL